MTDQNNDRLDLSNLRIDRQSDKEPVNMARNIKLALWIVIPIACLVIGWIILKGISPVIEVRAATATAMNQSQAQSVLSATGYVVASRKAQVASKATGRLEFLGVEEGDAVKSGQVLARVENGDMQAALDNADAILEQARADSTEAAINYGRQKQLLAAGAITKADFDISEARFRGSAAQVKSAIASVKSAEVALENTFIRAPFDGTVLNKYADVGEIVAPMSSSASSKGSVVSLADMNSLEVEADVAESNIQRVLLDQKCEIILDAYPDTRYQGFVKKIVPTADRSRATVVTKIGFKDKDNRVLPEMSARVNFMEPESAPKDPQITTSVMVPGSAVVIRNDRKVVFIVAENRVELVEVAIGRQLGDQTEILKGIIAGQKVILSPPSNLKSNNKVKISL